MWYCLALSGSGKRYVVVGSYLTEKQASENGEMFCLKSGGIAHYEVEIADNTPQYKIKGAINYQMLTKYNIPLDNTGFRHYKK